MNTDEELINQYKRTLRIEAIFQAYLLIMVLMIGLTLGVLGTIAVVK